MQASKRNGKIEFLRFVFCIAVLLFHCGKYVIGEPECGKAYNLSLFCHGSMGVEFFFVVSGVLMAKSACKKNQRTEDLSLAEDSLEFLKRKYFSIFPMHVVAFILAFVSYVASNRMDWLQIANCAVESIPSLFLVQMTGLGMCSPNHVTWYISCMLIAMAILYPLCRKYYEMFTHYIAPVGAILLLGYCMAATGRLTGVSEWVGITYKSVFRAMIEIALGAAAFEVVRTISEKDYGKTTRKILAFLELLLFGCIMIYCVGTFPRKWEELELFAILLLVILAFSGISYGSGFFDRKIFYHLGKLSMPLYLGQVSVINFVTGFFGKWSHGRQILVIVVLTFVIAYVLMGADKVIRYGLDQKKISQQRGNEAL